MPSPVFRELLRVMLARRGPCARLDIPEAFDLIEALFTPEEAAINTVLGKQPEPVDSILSAKPSFPAPYRDVKTLVAALKEGEKRR